MNASRSIAALSVLALLSGCATTRAEKACIVASVADLASTAYALESSDTAREANPALTIAGDDTATALVTSALVSVGWLALMRKLAKRDPETAAGLHWTCAGVRGGVALHNLDVAKKGKTE